MTGVQTYALPIYLSNQAREALSPCDRHLALQADEVIGPEPLPDGKKRATFRRLNFWTSTKLVTPHWSICGSTVNRLAPLREPYVGDAENLNGLGPLLSEPQIFHYGFIRKPGPFVAKSKPMHTAYFGHFNPCLERITETDKRGWEECLQLKDCVPYPGAHPALAHEWLRERGYEP